MRRAISIILNIIDFLFLILFFVSIYYLIITNYSGFNFIPFAEYGSLIIVSFLLFYYFRKIIWSVEKNVQTGPESLINKTGIVTKELNPEGEVRINGIIWHAKSLSNEKIEQGSKVIVKKIENLTVIVEKINN